MKLLIATTNPAKINHYTHYFNQLTSSLEVYSLLDLGCMVAEPVENGQNELENSQIKAKYYLDQTNFDGLVFAEDSGMILHGVKTVENPRKDIKKPVIDKYSSLTPENTVQYYSELAQKYGDRIYQEWAFGYTLLNKDKQHSQSLTSPSVLVSEISQPFDIGYPLNSVTKVIVNNQEVYLNQLDPKEWKQTWDKKVIPILDQLLTHFLN